MNDARQLFVEIGATARVHDCDDLPGTRGALADDDESHTTSAAP